MRPKTLLQIPVDKLIPHPENPNKMPKATFKKLVENIRLGKNYEPLIVRKHPDFEHSFEIINGHHRLKALKKLGYSIIDCVEWDVDDDQTRILLTTLNRLGGKDELGSKIELIKTLTQNHAVNDLAKLLPETKTQIQKLRDITAPPAGFEKQQAKAFLNTRVFFLNDQQLSIVDRALELTWPRQGTTAEKNAEAITLITEKFLNHITSNQRKD